ncbi:MAG: outer membrane beta-barrel protein [Janthinobacterium lividum]
MVTNKLSTFLIAGALGALQPALVTAQSNTRNLPGYVVTAAGDTLRGMLTVPRFATDQGLTLLPDNAPSAARKFSVQTVRAFGWPDGRCFVKRSLASGRNAETGAVDSVAVLLQRLVGGAANFYRYDVDMTLHRGQAEYTQSETVQYFITVAGSGLAPVRPASYVAALSAVFKDCPAVVAAVPRTSFNERNIGDLVLRYNALCHAAVPAHDYRLPEAPSTVRLLVSLRAGAQRGKLFYPSSDYLTSANGQATVLPAFGVELRLAYQGPWSLVAGVHYARLRSEATQTQPAQLGTTNAGQLLSLPASVEVQSLQAPVLLRYTLGRGLVRPYLAAGPVFGMYTSNQTTLSYTTLTRTGGTTTPYRNDVVTAPIQNTKSKSPTVSGALRLGVQFKTKARVSPLLEAQYSAGSDSERNPGLPVTTGGITEDLGQLHYQAFSLMAGLEL